MIVVKGLYPPICVPDPTGKSLFSAVPRPRFRILAPFFLPFLWAQAPYSLGLHPIFTRPRYPKKYDLCPNLLNINKLQSIFKDTHL
jgi:hypothetical protein